MLVAFRVGFFTALAIGLVSLALPSGVWSQLSATPQSLVGEWVGNWAIPGIRERADSGQYHLVITKVEGNKVYGKGEAPGGRPAEFNVIGTLEGNKLTFGREGSQTELVIEGDQMRGVRRRAGSRPMEITLTRKK